MHTNNHLTEDIKFENTLLVNGIMSSKAENKLANVYDLSLRHNDKDIHNVLDDFSTSDLTDTDETKDSRNDTFSDTFVTSIGNVCLCFCTTSTPVRIEFDPYSQLFVQKLGCKVQMLQTFDDSLKEMRLAEDLLAETLTSTEGEKVCIPKLKKSFKKVRKSSKKGAIGYFLAITALTVILTTII